MKKVYITPLTTMRYSDFDALCIGIVGSTGAGSGNLSKEERELEEEEEEFAAFLAAEAEQNGGKNGLW